MSQEYIDPVSVRLKPGGKPSDGGLAVSSLLGGAKAVRHQMNGTIQNGTVISGKRHAHGGGIGPVSGFHGWLATLTMSSLVLVGCSGQWIDPVDQASTPVPTTVKAPDSAARSSALASVPLESAKTAAQSPVYWLGESGQAAYLYREFREVENRGDPITTAISAMTTEQPMDEDYFNPWQPASSIAASVSPDNVITVDISADAFGRPLDAGMARLAVQQLVYTATAAAASSGLISQDEQIQVVILVDGRTGYRAFGHVPLGQPMVRDASVAAPVWVIDPQDGTVIEGNKVAISGRGVSPDTTLGWEIVGVGTTGSRPSAEPTTGSVELGQDRAGTFNFSVTLPKGNYQLRVFQGKPGSERSRQQFADSKGFAIRGD